MFTTEDSKTSGGGGGVKELSMKQIWIFDYIFNCLSFILLLGYIYSYTSCLKSRTTNAEDTLSLKSFYSLWKSDTVHF